MLKNKILILSFFLFFFNFCFANAASLYLSPDTRTIEVGDKITMKVMVSSDVAVNAFSGVLNFSSNIFTIESVSKSGSIIDLWAQEPNFSQVEGTVNFEGVKMNGYSGGMGTIITLVLRAKTVGIGNLSFISGQILANDGVGTDITSGKTGATIVVKEKTLVPKPKKSEIEIPPITDQSFVPQSIEISFLDEFENGAIYGISTYKNEKIQISFVDQNDDNVFMIVETDINGEFIMPIPQLLTYGKYKVTANFADTKSNELILTIGKLISGFYIKFGIGLLLGILILIVLIVPNSRHTKNQKRKYNKIFKKFPTV